MKPPIFLRGSCDKLTALELAHVARSNKRFYRHRSRIDPSDSIACSMLSRSNFVRLGFVALEARNVDFLLQPMRIVSYRSEQSGASGEGNAKQRAREWRYESPPTRRPHLGRIASIIPARAYEMLFNLSSSRSDGALVLPFLRFFLRGVGNRSRVQGFSLARRFARIRVFPSPLPLSLSLSLSLSLCLIVASR